MYLKEEKLSFGLNFFIYYVNKLMNIVLIINLIELICLLCLLSIQYILKYRDECYVKNK